MNHIDFLISEVDKIEANHQNNECYYHVKQNLSEYYNWTLPPEYRKSLLVDKRSGWTMCSDIYYLMIMFYEHVTGHLPGVNFQMNDVAIRNLMKCLEAENTEKQAVAHLFYKCTSISESKRIRNASELKSTEAFRFLIKEN